MIQKDNIKAEEGIHKKRINPTFEALVRLKSSMHTNDSKYTWT